MGAKCSCSCFRSARETEASRMVLSESLCSKFRRRIKRKNKKQYSKPIPYSKYDVKISPNRVISAKSDGLVKIVSISQDREMIPVVVSPVGKTISNELQPAKKKKPIGLDAAEIKVESQDAADISVKSLESEIHTEESAPKQISGEEVTVRKLDRQSRVPIAKASRFPTHPTSSPNEQKVSQSPNRGHHAKDTKTSVIEQPKAQEIRQENKIPDSISGPVNRLHSKSIRTSGEVDSWKCKLLKSIDFHRKVSSHASAPNSPSKRREIKSAPRLSSASYSQLSRPNMATMRNSPTVNSQPQKLTVSAELAERKGTLTGSSGDVTGEGEGRGSAINLWVLIIIIGCLSVFSDRVLAVVCASVWWYLLPTLLKKSRASNATEGVKIKRSVDSTQRRGRELKRSLSDVLPFCPSLE